MEPPCIQNKADPFFIFKAQACNVYIAIETLQIIQDMRINSDRYNLKKRGEKIRGIKIDIYMTKRVREGQTPMN